MFPIRDHNPSGRTPYVTYALIALNIGIFISYWSLFSDQHALNMFFSKWAITPRFVTENANYATLITSMFLHGGFMHLAGNMLFLWIFGDNLEDEMGPAKFLLFYLATGIIAGLAHVYSDPQSLVPTVGASGAIAGVMGGYLLLYPKARVDILLILIIFFRIFTIPAWVMLGIWFALQLFSGITTSAEGGGVAYWAHAGGFIAGIALTIPVFLRRGAAHFWHQNHGRPPHPDAKYDQTRIPKIRRSK